MATEDFRTTSHGGVPLSTAGVMFGAEEISVLCYIQISVTASPGFLRSTGVEVVSVAEAAEVREPHLQLHGVARSGSV